MTTITPTTQEHMRQLMMTYQVASAPNGMWTISHPHFSGGRPYPLFASESIEAIVLKLQEIMATDALLGPGAYAESAGNGHFAQMFRNFTSHAVPRVSGINLSDLEIDL